MQRVEEDTYVGHFPAELFPGSQQLRHHRPHVRQREEGQLDKAGCLLRCSIICTVLWRREMKALLGDRKQSALYLFLLNTRMSIRMQDLKPRREIRSGQQPMFIVQWNLAHPRLFCACQRMRAGRGRSRDLFCFLEIRQTTEALPCCYGHLVLALDPIHNVHKHKHSVQTFKFIKSWNQVSRAGDHQRWIGRRTKYHPQRIIETSIWGRQSFWWGVGVQVF